MYLGIHPNCPATVAMGEGSLPRCWKMELLGDLKPVLLHKRRIHVVSMAGRCKVSDRFSPEFVSYISYYSSKASSGWAGEVLGGVLWTTQLE